MTDLSLTGFIVLIPADEIEGCRELAFIDNKIGLQENKTFPVQLTVLGPPDGGNIILSMPMLTIVDNDGENFGI